jgi:large repetitive protein
LHGSRYALAIAIAVSAATGACSPRTLVVVDCPDGGTSCSNGLLDSLIGWWRLNDAPGSTGARDWSGWGNDGTLSGLDPASAWVAGGPEGGTLSVQGKGYVNVPASASIDSITDQLTVAAWMNVQDPIPDYSTAISRQLGNGFGQHYHLSINSGYQAILFITTPASGQVVLGSPTNAPLPQQTWIHLAGTYDGSAARLYVNGKEVQNLPATGPFATETNPLVLSGNGNGTSFTVSEFVQGLLDEVMLYRRALSADEIARLAGGALLPSGPFNSDASP